MKLSSRDIYSLFYTFSHQAHVESLQSRIDPTFMKKVQSKRPPEPLSLQPRPKPHQHSPGLYQYPPSSYGNPGAASSGLDSHPRCPQRWGSQKGGRLASCLTWSCLLDSLSCLDHSCQADGPAGPKAGPVWLFNFLLHLLQFP